MKQALSQFKSQFIVQGTDPSISLRQEILQDKDFRAGQSEASFMAWFLANRPDPCSLSRSLPPRSTAQPPATHCPVKGPGFRPHIQPSTAQRCPDTRRRPRLCATERCAHKIARLQGACRPRPRPLCPPSHAVRKRCQRAVSGPSDCPASSASTLPQSLGKDRCRSS